MKLWSVVKNVNTLDELGGFFVAGEKRQSLLGLCACVLAFATLD